MQDGIDLAVKIPGLQSRQEIALIEVIADLAINHVVELGGIGQVIDSDDVGDPTLIERLDDVGADKTCCAGNEDGHDVLR